MVAPPPVLDRHCIVGLSVHTAPAVACVTERLSPPHPVCVRFSQRWLQGGKTEPLYVEMYNRAMDEMIAKLVKKTRPSGLEVRSLAQCILSRPPPSASPRPICVSTQVLDLPSAAPSRPPQ